MRLFSSKNVELGTNQSNKTYKKFEYILNGVSIILCLYLNFKVILEIYVISEFLVFCSKVECFTQEKT
jgi:hypothetical protein